ncbi:MAG TPA: hypothetical protein VM344_05550, partial [Vitreimonas sp.]|nr:hypothetical protein [Vitreimonas sp.]
ASPHGAADDVPERAAEPAADHADHAEHGDGEELGPVDVPAWTAGALGIALGLVVVACLVAATGSFGA